MSTHEMPALPRILIVDDDASLRELISSFLDSHGFEVHSAESARSMRTYVESNEVDVVILDVMMPGEDGLSLARHYAGRPDFAIIMISALGSETDRIVGLEVGADDYLAKPISPRELIARIRAVLRRRNASNQATNSGGTYLFSGWRYDSHRAILHDPGGVVTSLSQGELSLLRTFLDHPQRILSRDQLLDWTRHEETDAFDRAIDNQVSRLRRKMASRDSTEIIVTVRNEGYLFAPKVVRR